MFQRPLAVHQDPFGVLVERWLEVPDALAGALPFDAFYREVEAGMSIEAQELAASLLIELNPGGVDELEEHTGCNEDEATQPAMTLSCTDRRGSGGLP